MNLTLDLYRVFVNGFFPKNVLLSKEIMKTPRKRGRPLGPTMPCGWKCGAMLTTGNSREHFRVCLKRPKARAKQKAA